MRSSILRFRSEGLTVEESWRRNTFGAAKVANDPEPDEREAPPLAPRSEVFISDFGACALIAASGVLVCPEGPARTSIRERAAWTSDRARFCPPRPVSIDFFRIAEDTA